MFFFLLLFHTKQMTAKYHVGGMQAPRQIHDLNLDEKKHLCPLPHCFCTIFWRFLDSDDPEILLWSDFELEPIFNTK